MLLKLISLTTSLSNTLLLVLMIALGSQNLSSKHTLNLGSARTESLPTGFLVGMSVVMGSLSGGLATVLIIPSKKIKY